MNDDSLDVGESLAQARRSARLAWVCAALMAILVATGWIWHTGQSAYDQDRMQTIRNELELTRLQIGEARAERDVFRNEVAMYRAGNPAVCFEPARRTPLFFDRSVVSVSAEP